MQIQLDEWLYVYATTDFVYTIAPQIIECWDVSLILWDVKNVDVFRIILLNPVI